MAPAAHRHHIIILLQNHVLLVVEVQQADGLQFVRHATGGAHVVGQLECVHDGLHGGVVGGAQALPEREGAGALAVVGVVAPRGYDPARPSDFLEVHEQGNPLAGLRAPAEEGRDRSAFPVVVVVARRGVPMAYRYTVINEND